GFFADGIRNVIDMWLGVLPIVMAMGGIALIIAEYTPFFEVLGTPFIPLLNLLGVPEADPSIYVLDFLDKGGILGTIIA
ncbi:Membrane protein, partial [human gut metagenome]